MKPFSQFYRSLKENVHYNEPISCLFITYNKITLLLFSVSDSIINEYINYLIIIGGFSYPGGVKFFRFEKLKMLKLYFMLFLCAVKCTPC